MGILTGTFTPNQAGTPLTLGSINVTPLVAVNYCITSYDKVASHGSLSTAGMFQCNIPAAMVNSSCAVNIAFLIA